MKFKVTKDLVKHKNSSETTLVSLIAYNGLSATVFGLIILVFISVSNGIPTFPVKAQVKEVSVIEERSAFIEELKNSGLDPFLLDDVIRKEFSVKGEMIAIDSDNIQVFEYISASEAKKEANEFAKKQEENRNTLAVWDESRKKHHIYTRDTLVVFYMGERERIIETLTTLMGPSIIKM